MTFDEIMAELDAIAAARDFSDRSEEVVNRWVAQGAGVQVVAPVVRFIEEHPTVDFGIPGALVHFVERFHGQGYEEALVESVLRRPTVHTAWMLNRVINGTDNASLRERLISVMRQAWTHGRADAAARSSIGRFLERLGRAV